MVIRAPSILLLTAALGCSGDSTGSGDASATAATTATQSASASQTASATATQSSSESESASASTTTGVSAGETQSGGDTLKLDVGFDTEGPTGGPSPECPNVDILFVIDSSGSMADQQESLIASFDGFVQGIQEKLSYTESYHVGVVTSSAYYDNVSDCTAIGDLIVKTGGPESSNQLCLPFASGRRYLDESEPDLAAKFACAAKVGTGGSDDEAMARGMLDALKPAKSMPGGCNEGFSRQDSLTVIVLITDEDDVPEPYGCDPNDQFNNPCMTVGSGGTPDEWKAELLSYKGGLAENIVVLSLLGQKLDNSCGAVPASKLIGFTNKWGDNGYTGDVCSTSYDEFFAAALPVVDEACVNYVPPAG